MRPRLAEIERRLTVVASLSRVALRPVLAVDLTGEVPVAVLEPLTPITAPPSHASARIAAMMTLASANATPSKGVMGKRFSGS